MRTLIALYQNALLNERIMGRGRCRLLRRQCRDGSWNGVRVKLLLASTELGIRVGSAEHRRLLCDLKRTWFSLFQSRSSSEMSRVEASYNMVLFLIESCTAGRLRPVKIELSIVCGSSEDMSGALQPRERCHEYEDRTWTNLSFVCATHHKGDPAN
ncbi:hypothetical protein HYPSUDRAFT_91214 [Hypholoma sublateritium FD-334 SS-4]|uniref:Uncharacterized protein n=1 Tax=Hypholoma sublateritium (strain FD-334 SS-4) TaxID=945553 RepID=A0A0D2NJ51_HYPSF|nr:hypothetical protein HYPSUDRAFT_91214 [Hypholoma sublateritium FD-334 SS-4]